MKKSSVQKASAKVSRSSASTAPSPKRPSTAVAAIGVRTEFRALESERSPLVR